MKTRLSFAILALSAPGAALALATPALASPALAAPAPVAAQPGTRFEKALAFVKILNGPERMKAQIRDGYFSSFRAAVKSDPRAAAVEDKFPGFFEELGEACFPYLEKLVLDNLPELWRLQATLLSERMTDAELDELVAFLTSPEGLRIVDALAGAMTGDNIRADVRASTASGKMEVSTDSVARDLTAAGPQAYAALNDHDRAAVLAFSRTAGYRKLLQINPEMLQIITSWSNTLLQTPGLQAEVARQAQAIVKRRTESPK